ncbi:Glycoside hydrolase, family 3 [Niveomyces insectorum RCEF 264]|uniref:beta-glucosidase n=1 Tax=Niveomyces insectorum RCEF 264 TaxID=1081102 RepID=A0A167MH36_9HYPO|nr:Glycoside hydrolase, family 3 [Niveomyces insectorum RCEF 264]
MILGNIWATRRRPDFVGNEQETNRNAVDSKIAERPLREIYLRPFEIALREAAPWAVMSSYNLVNGVHADMNQHTLKHILRGEWGYDGTVISDWDGTTSSVESIKAGCDIEFPYSTKWRFEKVIAALKKGSLTQEDIDRAAENALTLVTRVKGDDMSEESLEREDNRQETRDLIREAGVQGLTLLKNEGSLLPLNPATTKLAVIGPNANRAIAGGGGSASLNPYYTTLPLESIVRAVEAAGNRQAVAYAVGCHINKWLPVASPFCTNRDGTKGVTIDWFAGDQFAGAPILTQTRTNTDLFLWDSAPLAQVGPKWSAVATTYLTPKTTGRHTVSFMSVGPGRLFIDGREALDLWDWTEEGEAMFDGSIDYLVDVDMQAGRSVEIKVEMTNELRPLSKQKLFNTTHRYGGCRIGFKEEDQVDYLQQAVGAAQAADVAVVIVGVDAEWESEGYDRQTMDLPLDGSQNRLIDAVVAANSKTIVINQSGSPVAMPWADRVPAILQAWYQGQEAGNALADVLFGIKNPSGKLPCTFPKRLEDAPAYHNWPGENSEVIYGEGLYIGYRHYERAKIAPLFPFGHGLSYTTFEYGRPSINTKVLLPEESSTVEITLAISNIGDVAGAETVQVYVQDEKSRLPRPEKELSAFGKVFLDPGETQHIRVSLDKYAVGYYDTSIGQWIAEEGLFNVLIGASSADISPGNGSPVENNDANCCVCKVRRNRWLATVMASPYTRGYSPSLSNRNSNKAATTASSSSSSAAYRGSNYPSSPSPSASAFAFAGSTSDGPGALFSQALRVFWRFSARQVMRAAGSLRSNGGPSFLPNYYDDHHHRHRSRRPLLLLVAQFVFRQLRHQLTPRRVFSVPHLLVAVWVLVLLWGERWNFAAKVARCDWDHWEKWPSGATPHRLVFVADPQIIDAHTYPGRPWPLSALTVLLTDNYMRRAYGALHTRLRPDTVMFLGDLFDGGREWRPEHGAFQDDPGSEGSTSSSTVRPASEQAYAATWHAKYTMNYWLREYARFGDIFVRPWMKTKSGDADDDADSHRRRRLIASLPGNHDLGFSDGVQLSVRDRFSCFFGESNRVDVLGNHTFVAVDTVSLSADTSDRAGQANVQAIYAPTAQFLQDVAWAKKKAVARELRVQYGALAEVPFAHAVEDLDQSEFDTAGLRQALGAPAPDYGGKTKNVRPVTDLPTILLSHVPLYRPPGTPCGPLREHWPPTTGRKMPSSSALDDSSSTASAGFDLRNAIPVVRGYQYQNVLSEADSVQLVQSVGNVVHAFSGDDHDYCAVVHDAQQGHVPEITVKSFSMAMGVPTPGFLMVSLFNPVDETGRPLAESGVATAANPAGTAKPATLQTHLCLLPNQIATYARYGGMLAVSVVLLAIYAVLVPVLDLPRFSYDLRAVSIAASPSPSSSSFLPVFGKVKVEDDEYGRGNSNNNYDENKGGKNMNGVAENDAADVAVAGNNNRKTGASDVSGFAASSRAPVSYARGQNNLGSSTLATTTKLSRPRHAHHSAHRHKHRSSLAYNPSRSGPTIQISPDDGDDEDYGDGDDSDGDYYNVTESVYDNAILSDNDYLLVDVPLGSARWRPATRRGMLGLGRAAMAGLVWLVGTVFGRRGAGYFWFPRRRRRGGFGYAGGTFRDGGRSSTGSGKYDLFGPRRHRGKGFRQATTTSSRRVLHVAGREFVAMAFRVTWMVAVYWGWLNYKG